ncbi:MAG: NTP transferase domain-containing protein [Magnetococcales bacterium]|nr:NTP transferase domain-containing protein [Magnetococcales bacterium]
MKVIILAAGFGSRLGMDKSKGLVEIDGDETFLDKHFRTLARLGITDDVVLVAGKDYDDVHARYHKQCVEVIRNNHVELNNGYSLLLAAKHMGEGFILINCDVICDTAIIEELINSKDPNSLVVDGDKGQDPEEMKTCAIHGLPYRLKKSIIPEDTRNMVGEFAGMCKIADVESINSLISILSEMSETQIPFYWEDALEDHMSKFRYGITFTKGRKWLEVDFMEDYHQAKEMFGYS